MEQRIVGGFERLLVSLVNDIHHIESQSLNSAGVVKIFLQPKARIDGAVAQITAGRGGCREGRSGKYQCVADGHLF